MTRKKGFVILSEANRNDTGKEDRYGTAEAAA